VGNVGHKDKFNEENITNEYNNNNNNNNSNTNINNRDSSPVSIIIILRTEIQSGFD
jgi:hypothetical protein